LTAFALDHFTAVNGLDADLKEIKYCCHVSLKCLARYLSSGCLRRNVNFSIYRYFQVKILQGLYPLTVECNGCLAHLILQINPDCCI
jgi:hypothetical protein